MTHAAHNLPETASTQPLPTFVRDPMGCVYWRSPNGLLFGLSAGRNPSIQGFMYIEGKHTPASPEEIRYFSERMARKYQVEEAQALRALEDARRGNALWESRFKNYEA